MNKKLFIILVSLVTFFGGLIVFEKLTTFPYYRSVHNSYEKEGIIYLEVHYHTSWGFIYDVDLVNIGNGVYEVKATASAITGKNLFEFNNKDGHIKEIRDYRRDGTYDVVYKKE